MTAKVNYISATQASDFVQSLIGKTSATSAMVAIKLRLSEMLKPTQLAVVDIDKDRRK